MKSKKMLFLALFSMVLVFTLILPAWVAGASFGISPPWVQNYYLLPGSHYETTIDLQSDTDAGWIDVHNDASYAQEWLTFEPGVNFTWPEGTSHMSLKVIVDIPEDAELGTYTGGYVHVEKHTPPPEGGGVGIVVGGAIAIRLGVTDEEFFDFTLRGCQEFKTEEGWPIKFVLGVENIGNINGAPTKVRLDVYDDYRQVLLQSAEDTTLDLIEPFTTKDIIAEFATTYLPIGNYGGTLTVYKGSEIAWNLGWWRFSVSNNPPGTPSNPSPPDNAAASPVTLGWTGGDPDPGDTVTYDVYFGTSGAPPQVSHEQTATHYDLGILEPNIDYYWKVVATDSHGVTIEAPLWNFTTIQHTLTVNIVGNGSVSKNPDQMAYAHGTEVELTATPDPCWRLSVWSGDMVGTTSPATITMNANKTVTATFTPIDCDYLDGWVTDGNPYTTCNGTSVCTYQDMVYLDYECVGGNCTSTETDWRTDLISCQSCDDGNPCTIDTCEDGACIHTAEDLDQDGYTVCQGDCDDSDAAVNPGATEVPYNGKDDNCDGLIDGRTEVETTTGTGTATFGVSVGTIENLTAIAEGTLPAEDKPNLEFPHGFFSFNITGLTSGATVMVTMELALAVPIGTQYWKYGPTPANSTDHWYQLPMGDDDGDNVITITLVDGDLGDDDLTANGVIVDQGGPGNLPAAPVEGCFIATAAYGTPMAEEIQIMRQFRDEYLVTNPLGQALVDLYYRFSPPIAGFITDHPSLKPIVRAGLAPAVAMSNIAVNITPAEKMAIVSFLVLVSVALAIWLTRRRKRDPECT